MADGKSAAAKKFFDAGPKFPLNRPHETFPKPRKRPNQDFPQMSPSAHNSLRFRRLPLFRGHRGLLTRAAFVALASALSLPLVSAPAATLTWDPGTPQVPLTGTYGSGTWDNATTNWSNGTADQAYVTGSTVIFGGAQTTATTATVTLGSVISALNMQFNAGGYTVVPSATNTLTLTGGFGTAGAGATIFAGAASGTTTTVGGPLTIAATPNNSTPAYFSAAAGNTLNLTGTITQATAATSANTVYGPGTVNYSGTGFATGKFNVQGGATFNTSGAMTGFTGTYAGVGGDSTTTSTWNVVAGGSVAAGTAATLFVGNGGNSSGVFTLSGGGTAAFTALNAGNSFNGTTAGDSTGVVTVTGSTLNVNGPVRLGSTGAGTGTLNLNAGSRIVIGAATGSIARGAGVAGATGGSGTVNFDGGSIQYNAAPPNPAIAANITTNILGGGATINTNSSAVIIASSLLHGGTAATDGGLNKIGIGILTLSAANTYTGPTTITPAGTSTAANTGLSISVNGGLSSSNVTLGATTSLTLAAGVTAAHSNTFSTLTLTSNTTSIVNLNAATAGTLQDTIGALVVNGQTLPAGTYGSATSGVPAAFQLVDFAGNGTILVTGVVPEPSTYACLLVAFGGLAFHARRRMRREA